MDGQVSAQPKGKQRERKPAAPKRRDSKKKGVNAASPEEATTPVPQTPLIKVVEEEKETGMVQNNGQMPVLAQDNGPMPALVQNDGPMSGGTSLGPDLVFEELDEETVREMA
jgi:hypothetical protein